jgi:anti-sigma-K factor RskA
MRRQEDVSNLRWRDALVIFAIISVLALTFLLQLARRSEGLPLADFLVGSPVLETVETLMLRSRPGK